jgi:trimeric autotransporter adhesin
MRKQLLAIIILLLAIALAPNAFAANDPGHDTLYVLKIGDSYVAGSINITANLTANSVRYATLLYGDQLDIRANGSIQDPTSRPAIQATSTALYIDGNTLLLDSRIANALIQIGRVANNDATLNVSGRILQQNVAVCLSNGTNCPNSLADSNLTGAGTANYISKWSDADTLTNSVIYDDGTNVGIGTTAPYSKLQVAGAINSSGNIYENNARVCTTANGLCGAVGGNGNVSSSTTSTDNAVVRYDGTTGLAIQNSAVTIDDRGNLAGVGNISTATVFSIGNSASVAGSNAIAIGTSASATNDSAVAIGELAKANKTAAFALGAGTIASGDASTAIGYLAEATNSYATAIGYDSSATGANDVAYGHTAVATGGSSIAIGEGPQASAAGSIAIGTSAVSSHTTSVAIGAFATTTAANQLVLGNLSYPLNTQVFGILNTTGNLYENNARVCTTTNGLCATGATHAGSGWLNTSSTVYLVNTTANVGIGTSNPAAKLHVNVTNIVANNNVTGQSITVADNGTISANGVVYIKDALAITQNQTINFSANNLALTSRALNIIVDTNYTFDPAGSLTQFARIQGAAITNNYRGEQTTDGNDYINQYGLFVNVAGDIGYGGAGTNYKYGIYSQVQDVGEQNYGVYTTASGGLNTRGIYAVATGSSSNIATGGEFAAGGSTSSNTGLLSSASASGSGAATGLSTSATGGATVKGLEVYSYNANNSYGLYFGTIAGVYNTTVIYISPEQPVRGANNYTIYSASNATSYFNGSINISGGSTLYAPQICLAGDCKTAWPAGAGSSSGWTNDSTGNISLVNDNGNISMNTLIIDNTNRMLLVNGNISMLTAFWIGSNATANGNFSVAIGRNTTANGTKSIAIGPDTKTNNINAVAIGAQANANGSGALAIGFGSTATGLQSVAYGQSTSANATGTVALGTGAQTNQSSGIVIGNGAKANSNNGASIADGIAIGRVTVANGTTAIAIGAAAGSRDSGTIAIGPTSLATSQKAIAIGDTAQATGSYTIAIGYNAIIPGDENVAIGYGAIMLGGATRSLTLGRGASSFGNGTVSLGPYSLSQENYSVAIGYGTNAAYQNSIALGAFTETKGPNQFRIGSPYYNLNVMVNGTLNTTGYLYENNDRVCTAFNGACGSVGSVGWINDSTGNVTLINDAANVSMNTLVVDNTNTMLIIRGNINMSNGQFAIGNGALVSNSDSLALGTGANGTNAYAIGIGYQAAGSGNNAVAIGPSAGANSTYALAVGNNARATYSSTVALGSSSLASEQLAVALGGSAQALAPYATAVGPSATANSENSTAVGFGAQVIGVGGVALGVVSKARANSVALGPYADASGNDGSVAIGPYAKTTADNQLVIGNLSYNLNTQIFGTLNATGNIYENNVRVCTATNGLCSGGANISGYGTTNTLAVWTAPGNISASILSQTTGSGNTLTVNGNISMPSYFSIGSSSPIANVSGAVAIGVGPQATGSASIAIGTSAQAGPSTTVAIGNVAIANGSAGIAIGNGAQGTQVSTVAIGNTARAGGVSAAAYGAGAIADGSGAIAIGLNSFVSAANGIALGNGANASHSGSVAIGQSATTTATNQLVIGNLSANLNTKIFGNLNVTENIYYKGNLTGYGADLAEYVHGAGVEAGDVVIIDPESDKAVIKSSIAYDTRVAGIVSTDPSHLMSADEGNVPLALAGRVPVKVSSENGLVKRGDLLTSSATPGHAMRCANRQECSGAIIGKAMENMEGETDMITALVVLG